MAMMVKEKSREKTKSKEKPVIKAYLKEEQPSIQPTKEKASSSNVTEKVLETTKIKDTPTVPETSTLEQTSTTEGVPIEQSDIRISPECASNISENFVLESESIQYASHIKSCEQIRSQIIQTQLEEANNAIYSYKANSKVLDREMALLNICEKSNAGKENVIEDTGQIESVQANVLPSAPMLEVMEPFVIQPEQVVTKVVEPKISCMPLEEAIRIAGGKEIEEVMAMSAKEEATVEAGPLTGPEHPLVDLLNTFKSSLMALERVRTEITIGYVEEEKYRSTLWKVEKRNAYVSEKCPCGAGVNLRLPYEHAELMKEKLPVARMKLEGLLRDVQDSYCHHQHAALLAHCQIEELICEMVQGNIREIREALMLVFQALRVNAAASEVLAGALRRWAQALSAALLDKSDLQQLLHLLHQLFRQTRSVRWAARVVRVRVTDSVSAARALALLDILLASPKLEHAVECTEEEAWEEVGAGGCGAVGEGRLRERDLLTLVRALPLRDLLARCLQVFAADISRAEPSEWSDNMHGARMFRAVCGVRALLRVVERAREAHPGYGRLAEELADYTEYALRALAYLYEHATYNYPPTVQARLSAELEACFSAGARVLCPSLHRLPATLLTENAARDYCVTSISCLHDNSPTPLAALELTLPVLPCDTRVRHVVAAAIDRETDHALATTVLESLFQIGIKRKSVLCKGACDVTAREQLGPLLKAHPYLYMIALHMFADLSQVESLDLSSLRALCLQQWRPLASEARAVLDEWARTCPHLSTQLLLHMDYTPHTGVSLDTQLYIAEWVSLHPSPPWSLVSALRPHRAWWGLAPRAAPPGDAGTPGAKACALLQADWGHDIPIICSSGVSALCELATIHAPIAVHCLGPVMLMMAESPDSIALTPKFEELINILMASGPSLMQRAMGRGSTPGAQLLQDLMITQIEDTAANNPPGITLAGVTSAWLHLLWRPTLPTAGLVDTLLTLARDWRLMDQHTGALLKSDTYKDYITHATRHAHQAPLLCETVLRCAHYERDCLVQLWPRLLGLLHAQRLAGDRTHVDNALKLMGANMSADELVIYRCADAALAAPAHHPATLRLWHLFMYLYLQRPQDSTPPCGPLFFSGLIKSRTLAQIKKRLQETTAYHYKERCALISKIPPAPTPERPTRTPKTPVEDDSLLPELSIRDLTGENDSSDYESSDEESIKVEAVETPTSAGSSAKEETMNLIGYHAMAEKMLREYRSWLEQGEDTRALPHRANIDNYVTDKAMQAAWRRSLSLRRSASPHSFPRPARAPPAPAPPPPPFYRARDAILAVRDRSNKRKPKPVVSSLSDVDFRDERTLLSLVCKHLDEVEALASEWSSEVSRVSSVDAALWPLVSALRVSAPIGPVKKTCERRCKPITLVVPHQEWRVVTGVEKELKENRVMSLAGVRRVSRPRPRAAKVAAALHTIARRVPAQACAVRACRAAWRVGACAARCPPARDLLTAVVETLAQKWLCYDGQLCADLLSQWSECRTELQQSLCGALVSPRRLRPHDWRGLYAAVLRAKLPDHTKFSYLSKFEMDRWADLAEPAQRWELLEMLVKFGQRWAVDVEGEHSMLMNLCAVQTSAIVRSTEVGIAGVCARAGAGGALPAAYLPHVARALGRVAADAAFDQLGHCLRELGVIWWEARSTPRRNQVRYEAYAPGMAAVLQALLRAFVAAGVKLTYTPEKICVYAWSAVSESWSPWVCPHPALPLLLSRHDDTSPTSTTATAATPRDDPYQQMLDQFVATLQQLMTDCPNTEPYILSRVFTWSLQTYGACAEHGAALAAVRALLASVARLPWDHQWMDEHCVTAAYQLCMTTADEEMLWWCAQRWRLVTVETWMRNTDQPAARLAMLLAVLTHTPTQTLDQAALLPWHRLPEIALLEAFDRYFQRYHNPGRPYHDLPQFSILLHASELTPATGARAQARSKRAGAVSAWLCAVSAPALAPLVPAHVREMLRAIGDQAPYLEASPGEVEELLSRAAAIFCIEPAAALALPEWQSWVRLTTARMSAACVSAAASLTVFEYFAPLAEAALRAHIAHTESIDWADLKSRLSSSPWLEAPRLVSSGRLLAAYAAVTSHTDTSALCDALLAAKINFVENEVPVAMWICYLCRTSGADAGAEATRVLTRWAEEPRRSLLKMVTLQADTTVPTPRHRALCRLALCVVAPSAPSAVSFSAACLPLAPDAAPWGSEPRPERLPRLATRLLGNDKYFKLELDLATQ